MAAVDPDGIRSLVATLEVLIHQAERLPDATRAAAARAALAAIGNGWFNDRDVYIASDSLALKARRAWSIAMRGIASLSSSSSARRVSGEAFSQCLKLPVRAYDLIQN